MARHTFFSRLITSLLVLTLLLSTPTHALVEADFPRNDIEFYSSTATLNPCSEGSTSPGRTNDGLVGKDYKTPQKITLKGANNAEKIMNFLLENGFSEAVASGIMGNFSQESNFSPTALNPSSGAFGIAQWLGGRKTALKSYGGAGYSSLETQLQFLMHELATTEKNSMKVKNEKTAESAAKVWHALFERAPGQGDSNRINRAIGIYNEWTAKKALSDAFLKKLQGGSPGNSGGNTGGVGGGASENCSDSGVPSEGCDVTKPKYGSTGGNGKQLSQSDLTKIYGNPNTVASKMVNVDFNGKNIKIHPLVAGCLKAVANEIKVKNITYKITEMGGYRRDGNGFGQIGDRSYHSYGAAVDINWSKNGFYGSGGGPYDIPKSIVDAFSHHGWSWGGDWNSVKDYMHFEFNGIGP